MRCHTAGRQQAARSAGASRRSLPPTLHCHAAAVGAQPSSRTRGCAHATVAGGAAAHCGAQAGAWDLWGPALRVQCGTQGLMSGGSEVVALGGSHAPLSSTSFPLLSSPESCTTVLTLPLHSPRIPLHRGTRRRRLGARSALHLRPKPQPQLARHPPTPHKPRYAARRT